MTGVQTCALPILAIVAAKTNAIEPVPIPTTTPHSKIKCHGLFMKIVRNAPRLTADKALITTLRTVNLSIKAAANGAVNPYSKIFIDIASEICDLDQPKESSRGTIKTDGADLYPAEATKVNQVIPAAIHAG